MTTLDIESLDPEYDSELAVGDPKSLSAQIRIQYGILKRELKLSPSLFDAKEEICWITREAIKHYLNILNNKTQLPLSFRLQVMDFLQQKHASYFDSEYITLALKSYQIAIHLLAPKRTQNHLNILKVTSSAVKLAIYGLKISRQKYEPIEKKKTTLLYQMVHHLYPFLDYLDKYHSEQLEKFGNKLCQYVILQHMDFFSKTIAQQNAMVKILDQHLSATETIFYTKGEFLYCPTGKTCSYLALYPEYSGASTKVFSTFPKKHSQHDMVLFDLSSFLEQICLLAKKSSQHLEKTTYCLIRDDLLRYHRTSPRKRSLTDIPVFLNLHAASAFQNKRLFKRGCQHSNLKRGRSSWHVMDYSKTGVSLTRSSKKPFGGFKQDLLVGVQWSHDSRELDDKYHLGFLRWYKSLQGEEQVGIEFFKTAYMIHYAVIRGVKSVMMQEKACEDIVWLPSPTVQVGECVDIYRKNSVQEVCVSRILEVGENYSRCEVKNLHAVE